MEMIIIGIIGYVLVFGPLEIMYWIYRGLKSEPEVITILEVVAISIAAYLAYKVGERQNVLNELAQKPFITVDFNLKRESSFIRIWPRIKNIGNTAVKDLNFYARLIILKDRKLTIFPEEYQDSFVSDLSPKYEEKYPDVNQGGTPYPISVNEFILPDRVDVEGKETNRTILFFWIKYENPTQRTQGKIENQFLFYEIIKEEMIIKMLLQSDYSRIYGEFLNDIEQKKSINTQKQQIENYTSIIEYLKKKPPLK